MVLSFPYDFGNPSLGVIGNGGGQLGAGQRVLKGLCNIIAGVWRRRPAIFFDAGVQQDRDYEEEQIFHFGGLRVVVEDSQ